MASLTGELVRHFLRRYPGAESADLQDPMCRWQIRMLRSVLAIVDMVLEDLGVDEDIRRQAMTAALFGAAPDPHAAKVRMQERAEHMEAIKRTVVPIHVERWDG